VPRVLIVCDGDDPVKLCVSSSFLDSPQMEQAIDLLHDASQRYELVETPQSQIDRFVDRKSVV
jgi:hypothetical protein